MATPPTIEPKRLRSIDALRGFDMFWIIRGDRLCKEIGIWLDKPLLVQQFEHVKWNGFRFYDLIFPLFLFIVGVVLPFSLAKYSEPNAATIDRRHAYGRIVRRTLLLIALGLIYNGFLKFDFHDFRWFGVLQRIGVCYCLAALAVLHFRVAGQAVLCAVLVGGYWALLRYVPAPGFSPFDLSMEGNLVGFVDRTVNDFIASWHLGNWYALPSKFCCYPGGDNEGILSTIPAVGTTLLGALAGNWLRTQYSAGVKFGGLALAAVACLAGGYFWNFSFPINKILWTSSFVLWAGGWSFALLALFYLVIDVLGFQRWAFFFVVIGMNPITIYVMQQFVDFKKIAEFFVSGLMKFAGSADQILLTAAILAIKWLVLLYLYRNKTFLRV